MIFFPSDATISRPTVRKRQTILWHLRHSTCSADGKYSSRLSLRAKWLFIVAFRLPHCYSMVFCRHLIGKCFSAHVPRHTNIHKHTHKHTQTYMYDCTYKYTHTHTCIHVRTQKTPF